MDSRRRSILFAGPAVALGLLSVREAAAQAKVPEGDATAMALGYKEDVSKVDTAKFKNYAKGNACSGCSFYAAKGATEGTCTILAGRLVVAKGWCSAWAKKA